MALRINDESVHEVIRRIARITGESQTQAVANPQCANVLTDCRTTSSQSD